MDEAKKVYKGTVLVDSKWHEFQLFGPVLHVGTAGHDYVDFWYLENPEGTHERVFFRVFGTGWDIDADCTHVGTAIVPGGEYVWHLFKMN